MINETPLSEMSIDSDELADKGAKKFIDMLRKIGPHSK
jgi:lipoate synthase